MLNKHLEPKKIITLSDYNKKLTSRHTVWGGVARAAAGGGAVVRGLRGAVAMDAVVAHQVGRRLVVVVMETVGTLATVTAHHVDWKNSKY